MVQHWNFHYAKRNCLTFALQAFLATNLDSAGMMRRSGLNHYHSPVRFIAALQDRLQNQEAILQTAGVNLLPKFLHCYYPPGQAEPYDC